jgi:serine/threonine protein phosphatase PrpC
MLEVSDRRWWAMGVRAVIGTDVGMVRTRNEDSAYVDRGARFFLLADGMGGCAGGDVASATAVDVVRMMLDAASAQLDAFAAHPTEAGRRGVCALIDRAVRDANEVVRERARVEPDHRGMGTTLEVAVVLGDELFVAHVGDSRTYLVRDGAICALTDDHTVAEEMRRAGTLSLDEAGWSPLRSVLTRAIGIAPAVAIDHLHFALEPGDRLLLCSDGLHDYFTGEELAMSVREGEPADGLDELVATARARGGADNITGIIVEVPAIEDAVAVPPSWLERALQLDADV